MCLSCGDYYDEVERIKLNTQKFNSDITHTFLAHARTHDGAKYIRCPNCGSHAYLRDISGRIAECVYCGLRLIKLNNSPVEVYHLHISAQVEYQTQKHLPVYDRTDGSLYSLAEVEDKLIQSKILEQKNLPDKIKKLNNILFGVIK